MSVYEDSTYYEYDDCPPCPMVPGKVMVLGGDGFCGWPTSLHLLARGYRVVILDNLSRRRIDEELSVKSLTPIATVADRIEAAKSTFPSQHKHWPNLIMIQLDVAEKLETLAHMIYNMRPAHIIHFAEQRSAPYSMKDAYHRSYTVNNNIRATHNLLCAIAQLKQKHQYNPHIIHLGSTGVYGYGTPGMPIPEGYVCADLWDGEGGRTEIEEMLYPFNPGSIYHMTKCMDSIMFAYYAKNYGLRITDLHQGVIWGTNTPECDLDRRLINRFDYDGDYGTVLNRFLMQAAIGYPLTVYGTGGQTRAFIHIKDSVRCIELAIENPPDEGDRVKIFNQMTECHNIGELAKIVSRITGAEIQHIDNPRKEDAENDLDLDNSQFMDLGLEPTMLEDGILEETFNIAQVYKNRCDTKRILPTSKW